MDNLFAYGTLMHEAIMRSVAGRCPVYEPGHLPNYRRRAVKGANYPAIHTCPGATVDGLLYRNLTRQMWHRLDRFEGEMYARRRVLVRVCRGPSQLAYAYVIKPRYLDRLDSLDWDFQAFLTRTKAKPRLA